MKLCIDVGHNNVGGDIGSRGINGVKEEEINFNVAMILRDLFAYNKNVDVIFTRNEDNINVPRGTSTLNESLKERCLISDKFGADLLISLHCNAFSSPSAKGVEVFYYDTNAYTKNIANYISKTMSNAFGMVNRGGKSGNHLYMVKNPKAPAILIEMGFLTNDYDYNQLTLNQSLYAYTLYNTICTILGVVDSVQNWEDVAIQWATQTGVSDGTRPLENVTRVEAMQMLKNLYEVINKK